MTVAVVSFFTFLVAGFNKNAWISLAFGCVLLIAVLLFIRYRKGQGDYTPKRA
jgi:hypothetical protein